MDAIESVLIYFFIVMGAAAGLLSKGGYIFLQRGDYVRGGFFLVLTALVVIAIFGNILSSTKNLAMNASRWILLLFAFWAAYNFARDHFAPWLPLLGF